MLIRISLKASTLFFLLVWSPARAALGPGDEAPAFFVRDLAGNKHTLSPVSLVPGKPAPSAPVYVLDFFATWCKPCQRLVPHLEELQKAYGTARLRVLLVNYMEDKATFSKFLAEKGISLAAAHDLNGALVARRYGLLDDGRQALPITVVIGKDKKIAAFLRGEVKDKEKALDEALQDLLGPRPSATGAQP